MGDERPASGASLDDVIAHTRLIGVAADGREWEVQVYIGRPRPREGDWVCTVGVRGLDTRPRNTYGADSFQALCLALRHVRTHLLCFIESGGQLFFPDAREQPVPLSLLFPPWDVE